MSRRGVYRTKITSTTQGTQRNRQEDQAIEAIDDLAEFEAFKQEILPKIREQLAKGAATKDILNTARAVAVGRLAMIAALEGNPDTALRAIKELLERTDGKVSEKKEITHQLASMRDEELDALLITAATESDED